MKLKNIIMAIGVLAAFSACSNNDDMPEKGGTVSLSVKVTTNARTGKEVQTKVPDPFALPGEQNINTLSAFVFSAATQQILGYLTTTPNTTEEAEIGLDITEAAVLTAPAMIVLVSNAPEAAMQGITTYGQLQGALAQLADQQQSSLTMSTQLITTAAPLATGNNFIGFPEQTNVDGINTPLWLTRLPARLHVTGAATNFTREELLGRTVTINNISYTNVKTDSYFFSEADWGVVQSAGGTAASGTIEPDGVVIDNANPRTDLNYVTYVMENLETETPTSILVSATLSASAEYTAETVLFTMPINSVFRTLVSTDGIDVSHQYVKRNFIYDISMTFGDNAFEGTTTVPDIPPPPPVVEPDPTVFSVMVEVMGWGIVNQPTNPE